MFIQSQILPKKVSDSDKGFHCGRGEGGGGGDWASGNLPPSLDRLALSRHRCGRDFLTIQCLKCGHQRVILAGSRDRTCPACAKELYRRIFDRYEGLISKTPNLKFLTLTWKPVRVQDRGILKDMGRALNRLLHRSRYRRAWKGVLAVVECKKTRSGLFYYHIHALISGAFVPQAIISKDWREVSGFPVVYVKRISRTPKRALRYVLKYVLKGFAFDEPKDRADFKESMKGARYIRSYGGFYDFEYRTGRHVYFPCPECGAVRAWVVLEFCDLVDLVEGEPYYPP